MGHAGACSSLSALFRDRQMSKAVSLLTLASLGPVQPLVVGHYGEMGGYVDELLELAADAGADKHRQSMRCRDPDTARGIILQVLRRSWGMAVFRENARLIVRRLGRLGVSRAFATIRNSESTHRRLRRVYENAAARERCRKASGTQQSPGW